MQVAAVAATQERSGGKRVNSSPPIVGGAHTVSVELPAIPMTRIIRQLVASQVAMSRESTIRRRNGGGPRLGRDQGRTQGQTADSNRVVQKLLVHTSGGWSRPRSRWPSSYRVTADSGSRQWCRRDIESLRDGPAKFDIAPGMPVVANIKVGRHIFLITCAAACWRSRRRESANRQMCGESGYRVQHDTHDTLASA
jgi:hypothetical protein